jgi:hypothetical protein
VDVIEGIRKGSVEGPHVLDSQQDGVSASASCDPSAYQLSYMILRKAFGLVGSFQGSIHLRTNDASVCQSIPYTIRCSVT